MDKQTYRKYFNQLIDAGMSKSEAQLEMDGTILLYQNGVMDYSGKDRGFYTEWQLSEHAATKGLPLDHADAQVKPDNDYLNDLAAYTLRDLSAVAAKWCTTRQRDCLELLAVGETFVDVGKLLGISEAMVRKHVRNGARRIADHEPYWGVYEIIARACGVSVADAKYYVRRVQ